MCRGDGAHPTSTPGSSVEFFPSGSLCCSIGTDGHRNIPRPSISALQHCQSWRNLSSPTICFLNKAHDKTNKLYEHPQKCQHNKSHAECSSSLKTLNQEKKRTNWTRIEKVCVMTDELRVPRKAMSRAFIFCAVLYQNMHNTQKSKFLVPQKAKLDQVLS